MQRAPPGPVWGCEAVVAGRDSSNVLLVLKFVTQRLSAALCATAVPPAVAAAALTQQSDLPDF